MSAAEIKRVRTMTQLRQDEGSREQEDVALRRCNQRLVYVPFSQVRTYHKPLFKPYSGEQFEDLTESIRQYGILVPPIVRPIEDTEYEYEMLAGQNRMRAGFAAGLEGAHCMVKEGLTEQEALMYVIATNIFQRSFKDLAPSEKAAVLAYSYSDMFSQGKRNDILRELEELENNAAEIGGNRFHKLSKSRDDLGENYGLTGRAVANYLRINELSFHLKCQVDFGRINLMAGVQLSYINEEGQGIVSSVLSQTGAKLEKDKAAQLRTLAAQEALDEETALVVLESAKKGSDGGAITLSKQTQNKYFKPGTPKKEIEKTLERAMSLYFLALHYCDDPESLIADVLGREAM